MAVTTAPAEAPVEKLKKEIVSTGTTSTATLNLLRALLGLDLANNDAKTEPSGGKDAVSKPPKRVLPNSMKQQPRRPKAQGASDFTIYEPPRPAICELSKDARRRLATETFNATLKQLSDAAKTTASVSGAAKKICIGNNSPQKPLQNASPNRKPRTSTTSKPGKLLQTTTPENPTGLESTADCACSAFDYLRSLKGDASDGQASGETDWRLERGGLIMLDKLTTLKLKRHACEEVVKAKLHLQRRARIRNKKDDSSAQDLLRKAGNGKSLSDALLVDFDFQDKNLFGLVTSLQSQILRVALLMGRSSINEGILAALRPSQQLGPSSIILKGVEQGLVSPERAMQQLRTLSQALMTLCACGNEDSLDSTAPEAVFELRCLALQIRCQAWKLLPQGAEAQHEIWLHFGRALSRYREECKLKGKEDYVLVKRALQSLQKTVGQTDGQDRLPASVTTALAEMAQSAGLVSDSLALLEAQVHDVEGQTRMGLILYRCKVAALRLNSWKDDPPTSLASAAQALELLKGNLKGSIAEMNDLLLFGARVRKAALGVIADVEARIRKGTVAQVDMDIQICAIRLVYAFLQFAVRYLGAPLSKETNSAGTRKKIEQSQVLEAVGYKAVEAVLIAVKSSRAWMAVLLAETDLALQKCGAMAKLLEGHISCPSLFVRLSNVYWSRYLEGKDVADCGRERCHMLERSTELLVNRTSAEQEQGFLTSKYSKLSALYLEMKSTEKARKVQKNAIELLIQLGALTEVAEVALSGPLRNVWSNPSSKGGVLGKALADLLTLTATHNLSTSHEDFLYDDTGLPAVHRAVLLEKQVLIYADLPQNFSRKPVVAAARAVLELYNSPPFRVCRSRFAHGLLVISSRNGLFPVLDILGDNIAEIIGGGEPDSKAKCYLSSYGPILRASVRLHWLLQTSRPAPDALHAILSDLESCLQKCSDSLSLQIVVDDPRALSKQLQSVADYAGMLDLKQVKLIALQTLRRVLECQANGDNTELVSCLIGIGALQTQIGDTIEAGRSFATAEKRLSGPGVLASSIIQWELAYAEYLLEISNMRKCSETLKSAGARYDVEACQTKQPSSLSRFKQDSLLAHGAFIASRLSFIEENLEFAILYGRQCIKLSTGIWMSLEKLWDNIDEPDAGRVQEDSQQNLVEGLSSLSLSLDRSAIRSIPKGAPFWQYVDLHFRGLLHVSSLCAHSGLYQDSIYYAEQAKKVGVCTHSDVLVAKSQSALALLYARASQMELASKTLQDCDSRMSSIADTLELCRLQLNQATSYAMFGSLEMAEGFLTQAEKSLSISERARSVTPDQALALTKEMATLKITDPKAARMPRKIPAQQTIRGTGGAKTSQSRTKGVVASLASEPRSSYSYQQLLDATVLLKIQVSLQSGNLASATSQLSQYCESASDLRNPQHRLVEASLMISEALEILALDPVHCVVAETTIGLPSRYGSDASTDKDDAGCPTTTTKGRKTPTNTAQRKPKGQASNSKSRGLLSNAFTLLLEAGTSNLLNTPAGIVHKIHRTLSQLTLLTSAVSPSTPYSPAQFLSRSLNPKDLVRQREVWTMKAEIETAERSQVQRWPVLTPLHPEKLGHTAAASLSTGLSRVFDALPWSWTVISLSLSDDKSDLVISRSSAGTLPFVLRIPLVRSGTDDLAEAEFSFQDAKMELSDIIINANLTAHDARGQADKAARKVWWAEREALDRRLEALLKNMENIWLGGFRGILSQARVEQGLLARFAESLRQSLDKHLPSRQKSGTQSTSRVQLHAHVIELFLLLGHPDDADLDDAISDLLYFVVDILQFSGERNAYDEVDFDIIMVEVSDALRSYHAALLPTSDQEQHTILILDSELHDFPWESLPCLSGQSVSRMPSPGELEDRLRMINEQNEEGQALMIPSKSGAYILNPSSDLTSTQETFEATFDSQLPGFSSIIDRAPSEKEFESCLQESPLVLYFGHGSGAQYIRARTIKKLKQCAVTFLMGCSSSKMNECGFYEPYGVPWNYMFAGSPAVVGTLWDVTDKDIDRFAMKTFTNWGLLDADAIEEGKKGKEKAGKGKKRVEVPQANAKAPDDRVGEMALDQAVAKARDSCVLRYLNGAAPVIYGVPVGLEKRA